MLRVTAISLLIKACLHNVMLDGGGDDDGVSTQGSAIAFVASRWHFTLRFSLGGCALRPHLFQHTVISSEVRGTTRQ